MYKSLKLRVSFIAPFPVWSPDQPKWLNEA